MRILITGASGFIVTRLFKELKEKHEVFGFALESNDVNIIKADLLDIDSTKKQLNNKGIYAIDVIIHLASILATKINLNDIEVLNKNNILSRNVALLAQQLLVKKIINLSSSSVYPNIDGEFSEDSKIDPSVNPDGIYGLSKFNSEIIINKLIPESITISHLRCAMVCGEGIHPTRIWPVMQAELEEKNTITVFGKGKRLINQVHISTLVLTVEKFILGNYPGIYNVSDETVSLKDLALRIINEKGNSQSQVIEVENGNTFQFRLNVDKYNALK